MFKQKRIHGRAPLISPPLFDSSPVANKMVEQRIKSCEGGSVGRAKKKKK